MEKENNDTTIGCLKDTLEDFKKLKLQYQAFIEAEVDNDSFLRLLLKSFRKFNIIFEIKKELTQIE